MRAVATLGRHRRRAKSRMGATNGGSTVQVMRHVGETTDANGYIVPDWAAVYVDLPTRLAGASGGASPTKTIDVGGAELQVAAREAHFPADTDQLLDGDLLEVTEGENAGLVLRLVETDWADQATARRIPVVSAERPPEWS